MDDHWEVFGAKLRVARALANMSLRDVGDAIGVSANAVSKYELGAMTPQSSVLVSLGKLYGVSLDWLMCSCPVTLGWHAGECADSVARRASMKIER